MTVPRSASGKKGPGEYIAVAAPNTFILPSRSPRKKYDGYRKLLESLKIEVLEYDWEDGNRSLYSFDPDNHQGEFTTKDWL